MSIRLSDDEAWAFLERQHTGTLTTLRRDGWPVSLPVWFVTHEHRIYVSTPSGSMKVRRVRYDDRANFLVESGQAWTELAAVQLPVRATVLDPDRDGTEVERASTRLGEKYADFRPASSAMPSASKTHYAAPTVLRLDPAGPAITWDNSRIRLTR